MTTNANQRKTHFIQPQFQARFIGWAVFAVVLAAVVSAVLVYFFLTSDFESQSRSAHIQIEESWQRMGISILLGNLVAAIIGGLATAVVVLYRSHKIAGPMYRMQTLFREVGKGNLEVSSKLRDQDQLQEVATAFGEMLDSLRASRQGRAAALVEMSDLIDRLQRQVGADPACTPLLSEMKAKLERLGE